MYSIFTYIYLHEWAICWVNVGKYSTHGAYGYDKYESMDWFKQFVGSIGKRLCHRSCLPTQIQRGILLFSSNPSWGYIKTYISAYGVTGVLS